MLVWTLLWLKLGERWVGRKGSEKEEERGRKEEEADEEKTHQKRAFDMKT